MTKQKIIDKAVDMFLELGFKSVTMDDIAESLTMSKKTLYQHFKNKTKLVSTVTNCVFDEVCCGIDSIMSQSNNSIEELYQIKKYVMHHLKNERSSPHYQLKKYYPKIYDAMRARQFEKMQGSVSNSLIRGVDEGLFRKDIDVDFITRMYFNGMMGLKEVDVFPPENYPMEVLMERYLEYHFRAIVTMQGLEILNEFIEPKNK